MLSFIKNLFGSKPSQVEAEVPYKVEVQPGIAVGTEAVYVVPEAVAPTMTPIPLVVELPVAAAAPAKKPAKPKALPKIKVPKVS